MKGKNLMKEVIKEKYGWIEGVIVFVYLVLLTAEVKMLELDKRLQRRKEYG